MTPEQFETRLDASPHVLEWRRVDVSEPRRYVVHSTLEDYQFEGDLFHPDIVKRIWVTTEPISKMPDGEDDRGFIGRLLNIPERKLAVFKFEVVPDE